MKWPVMCWLLLLLISYLLYLTQRYSLSLYCFCVSVGLRAERQSARMSKTTSDCLIRSGTGCFTAVPIWQQWASNCWGVCGWSVAGVTAAAHINSTNTCATCALIIQSHETTSSTDVCLRTSLCIMSATGVVVSTGLSTWTIVLHCLPFLGCV